MEALRSANNDTMIIHSSEFTEVFAEIYEKTTSNISCQEANTNNSVKTTVDDIRIKNEQLKDRNGAISADIKTTFLSTDSSATVRNYYSLF
jgi:hypothetical protein